MGEKTRFIKDEHWQKIEPLLQEVGFLDIETYCDLFTRKAASPGQHFAFRCKRPGA